MAKLIYIYIMAANISKSGSHSIVSHKYNISRSMGMVNVITYNLAVGVVVKAPS